MPKKTLLIIGMGGVLIAILSVIIFVALKMRTQVSDERSAQIARTENDLGITNQQVRRLLIKRIVDGEVEYVEILENGEIVLYDANMKIKKKGLIGFYRTRQLYRDIEEFLKNKPGTIFSTCLNGVEIIVETQTGTTTITGKTGDCPKDTFDPWKDIVDVVDTIVDQLFTPTPTLVPTLTPIVYQGTLSPTPTSGVSFVIPTITITPGGPTPLPEYQTIPPFTCDEYEHLGRPVNISNIICGAD